MQSFRWLAFALLALLWVAPASAQNAVATPSGDAGGVRISITPYLWMSGISGTTGAGPATGEIDMKFGDILSQLHFSAMTAARVDFGRWCVMTDLMYTSLGQDTGPVFADNGGVSMHTKGLIATGAFDVGGFSVGSRFTAQVTAVA